MKTKPNIGNNDLDKKKKKKQSRSHICINNSIGKTYKRLRELTK